MVRYFRAGFLGAIMSLALCSPALAGSAQPGPGDSRRAPASGWTDFAAAKPAPAGADRRQSLVRVAESTAAGLTLEVSLPGMFVERVGMDGGTTYDRVTAPGSGRYRIGHPEVPVFGSWILIPNSTRAEIRTDPGTPIVFEDVAIPPIQLPRPDVESPAPLPFTRDEEVFARDGDSPGVFAELEPTRVMRGQECAILWLYPYQYNPARRTLTVYPDLKVTVSFAGEVSPIPDRLRCESFDRMMRNMAVNARAVLEAEEAAAARRRRSSPEAESGFEWGWDYVIFAPDEFSAAAATLAAWKNASGYKTLVLPAIYTADNIKAILRYFYQNCTRVPRYVLLLGDADFIPTNYVTWHPFNAYLTVKDQDYVASDFYYATLDSADDLPHMAIGRIPVDTPFDADEAVARIIEYEKNPPTLDSFYQNAAIVSYFQDDLFKDGIEDTRYIQTSEDLALFLSSPAYNINKTVNRIYFTKSGVTPAKWNNGGIMVLPNFGGGPAGNPGAAIPAYLRRPAFAWDGDAADIAAAVEGGCFLVTHRDHGGRDKWTHPAFSWSDIQWLQIQNGQSPVIWSVNCQTGWFDNETDYTTKPGTADLTADWDESMAESWWSDPLVGGAVGLIAATRVTDSVYNDRLMWGWTDAIWPDFIGSYTPYGSASLASMGDVLNYGKLYMMNTIADDAWRKTHLEAYHWFGDPSMSIRTVKPWYLTVIMPSSLQASLHPLDVIFTVATWPGEGRGRESAIAAGGTRVTITRDGSPGELWTAVTDGGGQAVFPGLLLRGLGEYRVTAVAPDTIPFEGTFQSELSSAGGIVLDAQAYGCSSTVAVTVGDGHLAGLGSLEVGVESSGGDSETVQLLEDDLQPGLFRGSLPTGPAGAGPGDGLLEVGDGDVITAFYEDQDHGFGLPEVVTASAPVDCRPPAFSGLRSVSRGGGFVALAWEAASDPSGPVSYRIYRGESPGSAYGNLLGSTLATGYRDTSALPGRTYRYLVRARDALGNEDGNVAELGAAARTLHLVSPDGGERILPGSTYPVTWEAGENVDHVTIRFSRNYGLTWEVVASDVRTQPWEWLVPDIKANRKRCLIKVTAYDAAGNRLAADQSDHPFLIEGVRILAPNGGERVDANTAYTIRWSGTFGEGVETVAILRFTTDGGATWREITPPPGSAGSYQWQVPDVRRTKNRCRVAVLLKDADGRTLARDESDSFFLIQP